MPVQYPPTIPTSAESEEDTEEDDNDDDEEDDLALLRTLPGKQLGELLQVSS